MESEHDFCGRAAAGRYRGQVCPVADAEAAPSSTDYAGQISRTGFIALITAVNRRGAVLLPLLYRITRRFPRALGIAPMKAVHFTYWSLLTTIPYNGHPQLPERPARPYLFWGTVFNGAGDPYIEGFVVKVWRRIRFNWGSSHGFPTRRSTVSVVRYIDDHTWLGGYTYAGYPDATVRMIESAKRIALEHRYLRDSAAAGDAPAFARVYRGFLTRSQGDL